MVVSNSKASGNTLKKGIYLLCEPGILRPGTGAYQHINTGIQQLSNYFDIKLVMPATSVQTNPSSERPMVVKDNSVITKKSWKRKLLSILPGKLYGTFKYLYWLVSKNLKIVSLYRSIKNEQPDFIYERCCILDFRGVIIARLLKVPHFYENNGILVYQYHENFFSSYIKKMLLYFERSSHKASNFVFYVGTWGKVFNSTKSNWINIENGIEKDLVDRMSSVTKNTSDSLTHCCILGHLMKHHNVDILRDAIASLDLNKKLLLTFVGSIDNSILQTLQNAVQDKNIKIQHRGVLGREELFNLLQQTDIGIITGAHEYQSMMKLFDYGVAKCLVVCPDTYNLTKWFSKEEVLFFKKKSSASFTSVIQQAIDYPEDILIKGERLYNKIARDFTWEKIFRTKADIITMHVKAPVVANNNQ